MGQSGNESNNSSGEGRNDRVGEMYCAQYLNGAEGPSSSSGHKDIVLVEDGCGFSGRKEGSFSSEPGDSLRAILSDPITYVFSHFTHCWSVSVLLQDRDFSFQFL